MLRFPSAKINLGLNIRSKREDGFHELETVLYPIDLCDALEILPSSELNLRVLGEPWTLPPGDHTCVKAWEILHAMHNIPPVSIYLLKKIPSGAGLGGGSSDGAYTLVMLNELFSLNLSTAELERYALLIGSDAPFFVSSKPVTARGRGEIFESIADRLRNYVVLIVVPSFQIQTAHAYSRVVPSPQQKSVAQIASQPPETWKGRLENDFEATIFQEFPVLAQIKQALYTLRAVYASLSGSGSVVYGIFADEPDTSSLKTFGTCLVTRSLNR